MATIDSSYVKRELKAIIATSRLVAKLVKMAFEQLENNPAAFPRLETVPEALRQQFPGATFRKVKIEHNPHSFRLVVIHWSLPDREDHVDVIYAFPRKDGYPIDWDWVKSLGEEAD